MSKTGRREFLSESSRWAAALAAAGITGRSVADEPKSARTSQAADRIRIAVIGANRKSGRGYEHVSMCGRPGVELVAICDCDEAVVGDSMERAEKQQKQRPRFEKDLRRIFDDKSIDAVTIATPNHWHALAAIWAMQSGKHVYVEKPVSHNVSEGRKIVEVARKTGKICQTGTQARSASAMREMIEFLHSGKLGKIHTARALCYKPRGSIGTVGGDGTVPTTIDYDLWCGPAPNRPPRRKKLHYDWHWQWDYGNGDIGNQGIHQMDLARWGLNKSSLPTAVHSIGGRFGPADDGETANTQIAKLLYDDCELIFETRGFGTLDFLADQRGTATTDKRLIAKVGNVYHGADGFVICANYSEAVAVSNDGSILQVFSAKPGDDHFGNFLKAIRSGRPTDLTADIEEGHLSSALCHLANISHRAGEDVSFDELQMLGDNVERMTRHLSANGVALGESKCRVGAKLSIDSKTERITNHARAETMLGREYRKGFEIA